MIAFAEVERLADLGKHSIDFADVEAGFDVASAIEFEAHPSRTGRARFSLIGELNGEIAVAAMRRKRGHRRAPTTDPVSLRLDQDLLATLWASGSGWQSRVDDMLRKGLGLQVDAAP